MFSAGAALAVLDPIARSEDPVGTLWRQRLALAAAAAVSGLEGRREGEAQLRAQGDVGPQDNVRILTSCPSCLQGLTRYGQDLQSGLLEADYIVVEMARQILGENWMPDYVRRANDGGIERVLV